MATAYSLTREQLRDRILRKLRVLGADDHASSADADIVYEAIDLRLKELHILGLLWFKTSAATTNVTVTANVATATAPTDLLYPVSLTMADDTKPLYHISHQAYQSIEHKAQPGFPEVYHYSPANGLIYIWPTPEASYTAKLTYEKIIENTAASTAVDVPSWALKSLTTLCASDLADDFEIPEDRVQRLMAEAAQAEMRLKVLNAPAYEYSPVEADNF